MELGSRKVVFKNELRQFSAVKNVEAIGDLPQVLLLKIFPFSACLLWLARKASERMAPRHDVAFLAHTLRGDICTHNPARRLPRI